MKNFKISTIVAAVILAGCVSTPPKAPAIQFNYKTQNGGAVGIVQVFDMNGNTVVQIKNLHEKAPLFLNEGNAEIKYQVVGQTAVLEGIQKSFNVVNAGAWAHVTRQAEVAPVAERIAPAVPMAHAAAVGLSALSPDDELRAQITAMKNEIASLKAVIKSSKQDLDLSPVEASPPADSRKPKYAPIASVKEATSLRVTFKNNSAEFSPRESLAKTILELARDANEISVTGYTDGATATSAGTQLAKGRAFATRQFLVSNGIERSKIAVSYLPSGGFVADNSTKEGRDKNRRVEIDML